MVWYGGGGLRSLMFAIMVQGGRGRDARSQIAFSRGRERDVTE